MATRAADTIHRYRRQHELFNHERLIVFVNRLAPRQQVLIDALPLLLHLNHPQLPGHTEDPRLPFGFPHYRPDQATLHAASRLTSGRFAADSRPYPHHDFESLSLIDHGHSVDGHRQIECWLCIEANCDEDARSQLRRKLNAIQRLALQEGIELVIEAFDAPSLRTGKALGVGWGGRSDIVDPLRLEQFYLGAIHLAGRLPLWWVVPSDHELEYRQLATSLMSDPHWSDELVDLGAPGHVSARDFFRTLLWRFFAQLDRPCHWLPEILLIECHAAAFPDLHWLSTTLKRMVELGRPEVARTQAIDLLSRNVGDYLLRHQEVVRNQTMQHCIDIRLDPPHLAGGEVLLNEVRDQARRVAATVSRAYGVVTEIAQNESGETLVDPLELMLLGRRLYAAFDPRGGRIEWINPGLSASLVQPAVTLVNRMYGSEPWLLYQGLVRPEQIEQPLLAGRSALHLLAWCHFNGLIDDDTTVALHPGDVQLGPRDIRAALGAFSRIFPGGRPPSPTPEELCSPSLPLLHALFINFATNHYTTLRRGDQQVISEHNDPLSFGALGDNLVASIDLVSHTTWGEVVCHHFDGSSSLLAALRHVANELINQTDATGPTIAAFCFAAAQGTAISQRLETLFNRIAINYCGKESRYAPGYIFRLGRGFALLRTSGGRVVSRQFPGRGELIAALAQPNDNHQQWLVDPLALGDTPLPAILHANHPGTIQLFFMNVRGSMRIHILDECGSLYLPPVATINEAASWLRFCGNIQRQLFHWRPLALHGEDEGESGSGRTRANRPFTGELECYTLKRRNSGYIVSPGPSAPPSPAPPLRLVGEESDDNGRLFTLYWGDEHCSAETIETLVAILLERTGNRPPLLEEIYSPPSLLGAESADALQSWHYLRFRERFETLLHEKLK
jgi:adenylate cyclase class 1